MKNALRNPISHSGSPHTLVKHPLTMSFRKHSSPAPHAQPARRCRRQDCTLDGEERNHSNVTSNKTSIELSGANLHPERKNEVAAKMVGGVSPRSVADAVVVRKADPALADKVASGEVKVSNAKKIVQGKKSVVASQDVLRRRKQNARLKEKLRSRNASRKII